MVAPQQTFRRGSSYYLLPWAISGSAALAASNSTNRSNALLNPTQGIVNLTHCDCRSSNFRPTWAWMLDRKGGPRAPLANESCANSFRYALIRQCHSVNYDIATKTVTEWNVGCERCHGPGSAHVAKPVRETIVNPARLDYVQANDTCIQCHSQGQPLKNPINGKYYDWPVGFQMGLNLTGC